MEGFELSPQQKHLWSQARGNETVYRSRVAVRISGPLRIELLHAAIAEISDEHEILRTTYRLADELSVPLQVINSRSMVDLQVDASGSEPSETGRDSDGFGVSGDPPFDLQDGPLFRARLIALSDTEHVLNVACPALSSDRRGLEAFVEGISRHYVAKLHREPVKEQPFQYADAAAWMNEVLESEETRAGREYWRAQDWVPADELELPFAGAPSAPTFEPRRARAEGAVSLAEATGAGGEFFMLASWQCLLQRLTGEGRILAGYRSDGRSYQELAQSIGLFARALPLTGELAVETPFRDARAALGESCTQARSWSACFDWSDVASAGERQRGCAFVPFPMEYHGPWSKHRAGDVEFAVEALADTVDRFKLRLTCRVQEGGVATVLDYDRHRYREDDVNRLIDHLEALTEDAARRPEAPIAELQLMSSHRFRDRPSARIDSSHYAIDSRCAHQLVEEQAARTPDEVAVVYENDRLTYRQLNEHANHLAARLDSVGVGPETLVGLFVERSVDAVVGMLGILKSGGAYVPLDPLLPKSRLGVMLAESQTRVIVAHEHIASDLPSTDARVVKLGAPTETPDTPLGNVGSSVGPDNLAYVLFTSGSTGTPKAVAIEHRQLVNYMKAVQRGLDLPPALSYATVTTFAADLGNTAIYSALHTGGSVHVIDDGRAADPSAFGDYLERHDIDVLKIVPSHLSALMTCSQPGRVLPRKRLVLGGEPCSWDLVDAVAALAPECRVYNHYGPTEATVGVSTCLLSDSTGEARSTSPPIGSAMSGIELYVLDGGGRAVPCWFPGELYIGGATVARGYLNDDALTAERFVPDTVSGEDRGRLYRTGDLVRSLPNGALVFLGRIDHQVKIRGFRVELGEIESALRRVDEIRDAVVVVHTDDGHGDRIVAYVVAANGAIDESALRATLGDELPDHMVPSRIVALDVLPLTPNGKLDRRGLPDPWQVGARAESSDGGQRNEWEAAVAELWRELLDTDDVSVDDNFYDLGGQSLLAIQMITALEKRTGLHMSPRELVFHTLRQFAALCAAKQESPLVDAGVGTPDTSKPAQDSV